MGGYTMNGSSSRSTGDDKSYALLEHDHSSATLRTSMFGDDVLYVAKDPATEKQSKILLLKCLYFLAGIGGSTWGRFATIFYMSKGLSPAQIGIIEGAMPATKAICQPVWGILSDKMNNKKQVFLLTKILSTVFLMSFAIPGVADSFLHILLISIAISSCVASGVLDAYCLDTCGKDGKKLYGRIRLWTAVSWGVGCFVMGYVNDYGGFEYNFALYFLFSVMLIWLVWIKVPTFTKEELKNKRQEAMLQARDRERRGGKKSLTVSLDDQLLSFVNEEEKREGLAWQKEAGIGGAPGDNYSDDGSEYHHSHHGPANHDYSNAANALYSHHHSSGADVDAADADDDAVEVDELVDGQRLSLTQVLCRPAPLYFFLEMALMGVCMGVVERLFFIYLVQDLGASTFLCGLTVLMTVILELPIFYHSAAVQEYFGFNGCFLIAYVCYFTRVYGYTLLTPDTVWWVLVLEMLHGITFTFIWLSAVEYARQLAPTYWRASVQSILQTTYASVGTGVGSVGGGYILERYGGVVLYRGAAMCGFALFLFRFIPTSLHLLRRACSSSHSQEEEEGNQNADDGKKFSRGYL